MAVNDITDRRAGSVLCMLFVVLCILPQAAGVAEAVAEGPTGVMLAQNDACTTPFAVPEGGLEKPCTEPAATGQYSLDELMGSWKAFKKSLEEKHGTCISITLDDHHQQILNGPGAREGRNLFWWNMTITQPVWDGGKLVFKARGSNTDGNPPNGVTRLVGPGLNIDWMAYERNFAYVANLYLEQKLYGDQLMVAVGKMTFPSFFDDNKVLGWDFLSCSLARNQAFPHRYHTVGVLGRYDVTEKLYIQAGISDAQGIRSETGLNTAFHDEDYFTTMGEVGVKTVTDGGLQGNYRFYTWYDPQPLSRYDGSGYERDTLGFGISFDQMLTEKFSAGLRYGLDDGSVRKFGSYWSMGVKWTGPDPGRAKDVLGAGIGQGITHSDYRDARGASRTETIIEVYYKIIVTEWCSLTLDVQTLLNPGINSDNDTAVIPGFRLKMDF